MSAPAFDLAEPLPAFDSTFAPLVGVTPIVIRRNERADPDFTDEARRSPHTPPRAILWTSLAFGAFYFAICAAGLLGVSRPGHFANGLLTASARR